MDNVFIERMWRSLRYKCVYLNAFETGSEVRAGLSKWIGYYNAGRPHSGLGGQTPDEAYAAKEVEKLAAGRQPGPSLSRPSTCPTDGGQLIDARCAPLGRRGAAEPQRTRSPASSMTRVHFASSPPT
jgi:putative transposase